MLIGEASTLAAMQVWTKECLQSQAEGQRQARVIGYVTCESRVCEGETILIQQHEGQM